MIHKSCVMVISYLAVSLFFSGCGSIKNRVIKAYNQGQTMIIMPEHHETDNNDTDIIWKKADENGYLSKEKYPFLSTKEKGFLAHRYEIFYTHKSVVSYVDNGTYCLNELKNYTRYRSPSWNAKIQYNSTIGNVTIVKTPEKDYNGNDITSWYKIEYTFADNVNDKNIIKPITFQPSEIVMLPLLTASIVVDENTCHRTDYGEVESFVDFLFLPLFWVKKITDSNGKNYWYWSCPIKAIEVYIKHGSKDEFIADMQGYMPENMINKAVVRDFELGDMLKDIKPEVLDDGTLKYVIKGYD